MGHYQLNRHSRPQTPHSLEIVAAAHRQGSIDPDMAPSCAKLIPVHPMRPALGRRAPKDPLLIIDNIGGVAIPIEKLQPRWTEFWQLVERELKLRFYRPKSIKGYKTALRGLAVTTKIPPHRITKEVVRRYLYHQIERGSSSAWISVMISAIRTSFDKLGVLSRNKAGILEAPSSVEIEHERQIVELLGIRVFEPRDGWIVMDLPNAEEWSPLTSRLPEQVRQRLEEPEFYERLRLTLAGRFLARKAEMGAGNGRAVVT